MYRRVAKCAGAEQFMEFVSRLDFLDRAGYSVSKREQTIGIFQPLLSDVFPGRWLAARCVSVKPGGIIPLHRDSQDVSGEMAWRLLVVQTNPDAWVLHEGAWQHLEQDGIYECDQQQIHGAVNFGKSPRVHLVVGHQFEDARE